MTTDSFSSDTVDDALRSVAQAVLQHGHDINPTKGLAKEITGVTITINNPLSRISRTETRGRPFSCLGELLWYLSKGNDRSFISYYIPFYETFTDEATIQGGYGPRIFNWRGIDQFSNVAKLLQRNSVSRRAVIQLFDAKDIASGDTDVPCTCTLQFMIRGSRLNLITHMRSNDIYLGLPHDLFCFTMLQEMLARKLGVDLGIYKHFVGSLHIYQRNCSQIRRFLSEGWQSTRTIMPPMPQGNPMPSVNSVLMAEKAIRTDQPFDIADFCSLDPYWLDIIRLLLIFRAAKADDVSQVVKLRDGMYYESYRPLVDSRIPAVSEA